MQRGRLLADPYCYRDSQLGAGLAIALEKLTWDELFASTGIQTIEINTLFQLAWMARHEPRLIRSAHRFLMIASLMDYWLTGRQAIEHTLRDYLAVPRRPIANLVGESAWPA